MNDGLVHTTNNQDLNESRVYRAVIVVFTIVNRFTMSNFFNTDNLRQFAY